METEKRTDEFIKELPYRIEKLKGINITELLSRIDETDYRIYFKEWSELDYPGQRVAKIAETIVFDILVSEDIHESFKSHMQYELTPDAKTILPFANKIYNYVIYLQLKDELSKRACNYCKQVEKFILS